MFRISKLSLLIWIISNPVFGQIEFFNSINMRWEKINLKDQSYSFKINNAEWSSISNLKFENIKGYDLPIKPTSSLFVVKDKKLITIDGTGQIYALNTQLNTFSRLDNTFYRGYNFQAIKFVQNDTLFSMGGVGFWHLNNVESYYSTKTNELELYKNPVSGPSRISNSYGGFDHSQNKLCVIETPQVYDEKGTQNLRYFELDFKSHKWSYKGEVNTKLLKEVGLTSFNSTFIEGVFIFREGPSLIIANPTKNQISKYIGPINDFFDKTYEIVSKNGYLFSIKKDAQQNSNSIIKVDSIKISSLYEDQKVVGEFYNTSLEESIVLKFIIGLLSLGLVILGVINIKKKKPVIHNSLLGLEESSKIFLVACLQKPILYEFSSIEITELMGFGGYSFETQRQVRSKLIASINLYFKNQFGFETVISRKPSFEDKRFTNYFITEKHYQELKELFQIK